MESWIPQLALAVAAIGVWVWLARTARRDLFQVIYIQQHLGVYTPKLIYWLERRGWWLALGGVIVVGACLIPGAMTVVAAGMLFLGAGLLMYIHLQATRLLNPRLVNAVFRRLERDVERDGDGPGDPVPA